MATARELVDALVEQGDWPDPDVLDAIHLLGGEAVEPLREVVQRHLGQRPWPETLWIAVQLLVLSRDSRALPDLLAVLCGSVSDDGAIETLGDLADWGPPVIEPLLAIAEDESRSADARSDAELIAADAAGLVGTDPATRDSVGARLTAQLASLVDATNGVDDLQADRLALLVGALAELAVPAARPVIDRAFESNRVDESIVDREYVEQCYREPRQPREVKPSTWVEFYRQQYERHIAGAAEEPKSHPEVVAPRRRLEPVEAAPTIPPGFLSSTGLKLGRNDSCWCGSGKKYKKCHLDADRTQS